MKKIGKFLPLVALVTISMNMAAQEQTQKKKGFLQKLAEKTKGPLVKETKDEFEGSSSITLRDQNLIEVNGGGQFSPYSATYGMTVRKEKKNGVTTLKLQTFYFGNARNYQNWEVLDFGNKESLILLVDGQKMTFTSNEQSGPRNKYVDFAAQAANDWVGHRDWTFDASFSYPITPDQLKKIANAKEVKVRMTDGKSTIDTKYTDQTFSDFKAFYEQYGAEK